MMRSAIALVLTLSPQAFFGGMDGGASAFSPPISFVSPSSSRSVSATQPRRPKISAVADDGPDGVEAVAEEESPPQTNEKPKKKKKKKKPTPPPVPVVIDVSKLDIRVGVIARAWEHEEADRLFCEEIDVGEDEPRQIASGLRGHYSLDDLEGQRVLVLANLKARKLVGFPSHGMVMCAADGERVEFVEPPAEARIGERVTVEGFEGEPATENQIIKKKMLDVIFPDLKTDSEGVATYRGTPMMTSAGPCVAQNGMASADVA